MIKRYSRATTSPAASPVRPAICCQASSMASDTHVVIKVYQYRQAVAVTDPPPPQPCVFSPFANMSLYLQGGLRNSKHECTLSSQEYVHELRSAITDEKMLNCLESLRVSLTSNPVRSVRRSPPASLL